jgi:hemolysin type calcium-binding protein/WD40 repeat protein
VKLRFARRLGLALAVVGCAAFLPASAKATFPGANGKIVFSKGGDLWTIDPDGSDLTQLTSGGRVDWRPKWAPDGSMIAFNGDTCSPCYYTRHGYDGFGVYVWQFPDGEPTRFGDSHFDYTDAAWSPDRRLVFATEKNAFDYGEPIGQGSKLMVAGLTGGAQQIIDALLPPSSPDWSPLGDRLVVLLHYDGSVINFVDLQGNLTSFPDASATGIPESFSPSWSPDATRIAWAGGNGPDANQCSGECVYSANPDGSDFHRVSLDLTSWAGTTVWSPDASQFAFTRQAELGATPEIWLMNTDGSDAHFLTEGSQPDWQPLIAPRHLDPPRVGLSPREGRELGADRGRWLATPPVDYAYQWSLCDAEGQNCAEIAGATDGSYTPTQDDVSHRLRVTVTATNDYGEAPATSNPSAIVGESLVGSPAGELLKGTEGSDLVWGGGGPDTIPLGAGNDVGRGGYGNDWIAGGAGQDALRGGPGRDRLRGGAGNDRIYARDGSRDVISCGSGRDFVRVDRRDWVAASCEIVRYG